MTIARGPGWTLYLGDCVPIMATLAKVDHVITDPPYEKEAHTKARRALKDSSQRRGAVNSGKVRRIDQPLAIDFPAITPAERDQAAAGFASLVRRWVLAFCQIEAVGVWRASYERGGLEWVRGGVWRKANGAPQFTGDRPGQGTESIAIAHQSGKKRWNGGGRHAFWDVPLDHNAGGGGRAEHPTTKPEKIMLDLVSDFTDVGETVLDAYAGSGTTGVACLRLGRHFIGIEKSPKFFALACDRLRAEEQGSTLQSYRAGQMPLLGGRP